MRHSMEKYQPFASWTVSAQSLIAIIIILSIFWVPFLHDFLLQSLSLVKARVLTHLQQERVRQPTTFYEDSVIAAP